jgi:hypothetical protein
LRHRIRWRFTSGRSCSRATSVFFGRQAEAAKEPAHQRSVGLDAALSQQPVAQRLKGDVGFHGVTGFEELSMRLELQTLVAAHLSTGPQACSLETLDPFDPNRFADSKARRSAPAAHAAPQNRINHTVSQILRVRSGHSCWPPSSQQVESERARFENPPDSA